MTTTAKKRAQKIIEELSYMLHKYSVEWPFEIPSREGDEGMPIVLKHVLAIQREAMVKCITALEKEQDLLYELIEEHPELEAEYTHNFNGLEAGLEKIRALIKELKGE